MGKKVFIALVWLAVAVVVFILYLCREITPVKEFITWAMGVWPLIAILGACAVAISGWILKHDFSKVKPKERNKEKHTEAREPIIQILDKYEEHILGGHECGLIFHNSSNDNLVNCQARLLDLAYETPHPRWSLSRLLRTEGLVCDKTVAGFSNGKLPLVRWGKGFASNSAEYVYDGGTENVAYGVANTPILLILNIWAESVPATYAVCKLSDRRGSGYELSILKTGLQKDKSTLADFQLSGSHKEDSQPE